MAPQIGASIVAIQYGLNPPLVTLMVGVGTLLSFLTLPMWWLFLGGGIATAACLERWPLALLHHSSDFWPRSDVTKAWSDVLFPDIVRPMGCWTRRLLRGSHEWLAAWLWEK